MRATQSQTRANKVITTMINEKMSPGRGLVKPLLSSVAMVVIASCASTPAPSSAVPEETALTAMTSVQAEESNIPQNPEVPESVPAIFSGSDTQVMMPSPRPAVSLNGEAVMVNFERAPLAEVVHSILGETLGLDYVIEHPVKGQITLRTASPIPRDQLLPILESLLRNNNVLMIRGPEDRFFISGAANARTTVPRFESSAAGGFSNVIVPLQFISAAEMAEKIAALGNNSYNSTCGAKCNPTRERVTTADAVAEAAMKRAAIREIVALTQHHETTEIGTMLDPLPANANPLDDLETLLNFARG